MREETHQDIAHREKLDGRADGSAGKIAAQSKTQRVSNAHGEGHQPQGNQQP